MKKVISLILTLAIMASMSVPALATDSGEEYYTIQVEYSDNIGHQESLDVMIQNNSVFVNAEMLAERLGYTFGENGEGAFIYNKDTSNNLPFGITKFKYNSTQVSHMLFNKMVDTYEAPFASVKNSEGSWIPFEYSLLLLNSGAVNTGDAILIDIPTKSIVDYFFDMAKNSAKYNFDWADDFGYTESDIKVLSGSSHLINVFNGLLVGFDGASWACLFQQFAGSTASYDKKYGENLALLICTESDKELQAITEKVELLSSLLDENGDLGELLSFTSEMTDFQVGTLYKQCEAALDGIKAGNSSAAAYSRAYQALEKALDKQTWFSHTGGNILEVQKGVSSAVGKVFNVLDVGTKVLEIVGYAQEFQNKDQFSLAALTRYLDTANSGLELPEEMKKSMVDYSEALSKSIDGYMFKRFTDNIDQWIVDAASKKISLHEVLGTQAAAILIVWNIASKTIPFIANGLSDADNFELALYSMVFQGDALLNYLSKRDSVFADAENITAEHMYELSQYGYIYLKSCYITREAALASLTNKSSSTKEKIQPLIDYQNSINTEIAEIMVELQSADKTNENLVFGFLPANNEDYLGQYDDSKMIRWIVSRNLVTDAYMETYTDEYGTYIRRIPEIMLSGDDVESINNEIWKNLSDGISRYDCQTIDYAWAVNGNILSLVITINDEAWPYYYVYNVDTTTESELSRDDFLNIYGCSLEEYYELAEQVLGSKFWEDWDRDDEIFQNDIEVLWFNALLQKTISKENIDQSFPYINSKGELCLIAKVYSSSGADYYWYDLNMVNFTLVPDYATPVELNTATNNISEDSGWKEAYINYLNEHKNIEYWFDSIVFPEFKLVNINNDNIPELYIDYQTSADGSVICTYYDGKVVEQPMCDLGFSYIEGQNIFRDCGGSMDAYGDRIYSIENGQFVLIHEGEYGAADNSNVQYDSDGNPIYSYYWDGTEVSSETEYMNLLNEAYNTQQEITPFDGTGLCYNYEEIIEAILIF